MNKIDNIIRKMDELSLSIWNVKYSHRRAVVDKKDPLVNDHFKESINSLRESMKDLEEIIDSIGS